MKEVTFGEAMKHKYPEWVVLVVTLDDAGQVDIMPAGWAMIASGQPPMFAVAIGHGRYTHELLSKAQEFVVAFPSPGQKDDMLYTGTHSGLDVDKLANTSFQTAPASQIRTPLLQGCMVNLECVLDHQSTAGDHSIFVGRVVASHVDERVPARLVNFGGNQFAAAEPVGR